MPDKNNGLNRREFIKKSVGAVGLLAVLSSPLIPVLNRDKASASAPEITTGKKKARSWCMVIDLKKCEGCVTIDSPPPVHPGMYHRTFCA